MSTALLITVLAIGALMVTIALAVSATLIGDWLHDMMLTRRFAQANRK